MVYLELREEFNLGETALGHVGVGRDKKQMPNSRLRVLFLKDLSYGTPLKRRARNWADMLTCPAVGLTI